MKIVTLILLIIASFGYCLPITPQFNAEWAKMQIIYKDLSTLEDLCHQDLYNHPVWLDARKHIKGLIEGPANTGFLFDPVITNAMVRREYGNMQKYEVSYLKYCISPQTQESLSKFIETSVGALDKAVAEYNCTVSSLGHLYYAARILESSKTIPIRTIIDFGSGFGNFARIMKMIIPDVTLILIDFPELLALQHLYLSLSLPNASIIHHTKVPDFYVPGAIHLLPVYLINKTTPPTDCFVSTFALSESTAYIQKIVLAKKFFNASICYLAGQISGWGALKFVNQDDILKGVRELYNDVVCEPFHALSDLPSYELIARSPIG